MTPLRKLALAVAGLVTSAFAGWAGATHLQTPAQVALSRGAPTGSPVTAAVEQRMLSSAVTRRVTLRPRQPREISLPASALKKGQPGRVTRPPGRGAQLRENSIALEVSGRPVVALVGTVPMYRDLGSGDEGADVLQLELALSRLGLRPGQVDGRYDRATEGAVDDWLTQLGYEAQGPDGEARQSLRLARSDIASAEERLLQAKTARRTGTEPASRVQLLDAEREVRVAERAAADAEAQSQLSAGKVGVAQAQAEGSEADAAVAVSRIGTARLDVAAAEAAEATALRRVALAEQGTTTAQARLVLAERGVLAAQRREAAARRGVTVAELRVAAAGRAVTASKRRVAAAQRNIELVDGRLTQLRRSLQSAEASKQLSKRAEATAAAEAARDNQQARQSLEAARRSVLQATTDLRVANARQQEVEGRDPAASESEKRSAAADVQRATDLVASAQEAVAAAVSAEESTRLRGADVVAQAARASDEAGDAAAAAAQAVREGQEVVQQAKDQVDDGNDAVSEHQEQQSAAGEAVAVAVDAVAAAADEVPSAELAVQDARTAVQTASVAVSDAQATLATAVASTARTRDGVDEALAASLNNAAAALAAVGSVDEARATAGITLSTVAGSRELLLVARARLEQLREPKADATLRASEDLAARGLEDAQQALEEIAGDTGVRVPADEVLFLPKLPARVEEVRTSTGSVADGPLLQVTTGEVVGDGAVTLAEAALLTPGAKVQLTGDDGKQLEGELISVASKPGTGGVDGQHVRIDVSVAPGTASSGTGLLARIEVRSTSDKALVVPVTALTTDGDGRARLDVTKGRGTRRVWVRPGLTADGLVEVVPQQGELKRGDQVVVSDPRLEGGR